MNDWVKKVSTSFPLAFWNARGELLSTTKVESETNAEASRSPRMIIDVKHDDRNTPLTMKLMPPRETTTISCPNPKCNETSLDNLQWKVLQLIVIARNIHDSQPLEFPIEINPSTSYIAVEAPMKILKQVPGTIMIIQFQESDHAALSREIDLSIRFRERCFRIQATIKVQCRSCHSVWQAWHAIINTYDPRTFLNWQVTLSMPTGMSPPHLREISRTSLNIGQGGMLHLPSPLSSTRTLVGFKIQVNISVDPTNILMTLEEPIPLYFWVDDQFNGEYARLFKILNVNPSTWLPTPSNSQVKVTLTVSLKSTLSRKNIIAFLERLLINEERSFTIQVEGPILMNDRRLLTRVDVLIIPTILEELLTRFQMSMHWNELQQRIITELKHHLDRVLHEKLQKTSWKRLLPIHELLEVRTVRESTTTRQEDDNKPFPFLQLLDYLDLCADNIPETSFPTSMGDLNPQSRHRHRKIIVNGLPGIGKTSCAVQLVKTLLDDDLHGKRISGIENAHQHIIPLYLELGRTEHQQLLKDVTSVPNPRERLLRALRRYLQDLKVSSFLLEELNELKKTLEHEPDRTYLPSLAWFLDGWNESPPDFRREIATWLETTDDPFILFTRPVTIPTHLPQNSAVLHVIVEPLTVSEDERTNTAFKLAWDVMKATYQLKVGRRNWEPLKKLAWDLVKGLAETLGKEVLIPFFLIFLTQSVTKEWINREQPEDLSTFLEPFFKSRYVLLLSIFRELLRRHLDSSFLHPALAKLPEEFHNDSIRVALSNLMGKLMVEFLAFVMHSLYVQHRETKGTWFAHDALDDAFREAINTLVLDGTKTVKQVSRGWSVMLTIKAPYYPDGSIQLILSISPFQASSPHISESFPFKLKSCIIDVLFPRMKQVVTHQSSIEALLSAKKFLSHWTLENQSLLEEPFPTAMQEEREVLHELLADFFLAHAITLLWALHQTRHSIDETRQRVITPEIAEVYLMWMENEQFDEVWRQVFTSRPFNDDPRFITPFLKVVLTKNWLSHGKKARIKAQAEALQATMDLLADLGLPFTYNGHEWEVERSFRLRLSPRGIKHVQLAAAFGRIRNSKDRAHVLEELVNNWQHLDSLTVLDLSGNELKSLPESFGLLRHLKTLDLNGNQLQSLPESFGLLHRLETLDLSFNELRSLPETFGNLSNLQWLSLWRNQLQSLPKNFGLLSRLQSLDLRFNQLQSLPESFKQLSSLQHLELQYNQLQSLPESFGSLSSLQTLKIGSNQLQSLPESFGNLNRLECLDLSWNRLKSLPESFGLLHRLETLWLYNNQLQSLPESFGQQNSLQHLELQYNQLQSLPESFGDLDKLEYLDLRWNQLRSLPETLSQITGLKMLWLYGNPSLTLSSALQQWIERLRNSGCDVRP